MRVVVGMSGGVDSAVSAYQLKQQGHDVTGVFMLNWEEQDDQGHCPAEADYEQVRRVCDVIGVPYYTVNFSREYRERVFSVFLREYAAGRTPNPDVLCNSEIKFAAFLDFALKAQADKLATGHYARTITQDGQQVLLRGVDRNKDQSYFLSMLTQAQLAPTLFPLGELEKSQVRDIARKAGLPNAERKDSTGICFIGERHFVDFISQHVPSPRGEMVDIDSGKRLGEHTGLAHYTLGQRKGIGLGGVGSGEAWYVAKKDAASNTLYVCQGQHHPALYAGGLTTEGFSFIAGGAPAQHFTCTAKFRYRQQDCACKVWVEGGGITVRFHEPARAITPGQVCVLYDGEKCLGGGVIAAQLDD